jgi:hypothetical protein
MRLKGQKTQLHLFVFKCIFCLNQNPSKQFLTCFHFYCRILPLQTHKRQSGWSTLPSGKTLATRIIMGRTEGETKPIQTLSLSSSSSVLEATLIFLSIREPRDHLTRLLFYFIFSWAGACLIKLNHLFNSPCWWERKEKQKAQKRKKKYI